MNLLHPITNIMTPAFIQQNKKGEYISIKFNDNTKIIDESYIYDILFNSGIINVEQYNNKFWNLTTEYINN